MHSNPLKALLSILLPIYLTACPPKRAFHWNSSGSMLAVDTGETGLLTHADGSILRETALVGPWVDERRMLVIEKKAAKSWAEYASFLSDEQKRIAQTLIPPFENALRGTSDFASHLQSLLSSPRSNEEFPVPPDAGLSMLITHSSTPSTEDDRAFLASIALSQILDAASESMRSKLTQELKTIGLFQSDSVPTEGFPFLPIFEIRIVDSELGSDLPPKILHRGILPPENLTLSPDSKTATFTTNPLDGARTVFLSVNAQSLGPEGTTEAGPVLAWLSGGRSVLHQRATRIEFKLGPQLEGLGQLILHQDHTGTSKSSLAHYYLPGEESIAPAARWGANGLLFASAAQSLPALSLDKALGLFVIENIPSRSDAPDISKLRALENQKQTLETIQFSGNIVANPSGTAALLVGKSGKLAVIEQASLRTRTIVLDHGLQVLPAWRSDTEFTYAVASGHPKGFPNQPAVLLETLDAEVKVLSSKWPERVLEKLAK